MTRHPAAGPVTGRSARTGALWLLGLFLLSLPLVTTRIYATDEVQYFAYVRSVLKDGDLRFENEFLALTEEGSIERSALLSVPRTPTGRVVSHGTPGFAVLWAPWFLVGELVARAGGWATDGYSWPYVAAVCYGSAVYAFLALLLLWDMAASRLGTRQATGGALAAWWATALPFYMYVTPPMAHATSLFVASLFVWLWHRWRAQPSWLRFGLLGLVGGVMVTVRESNALFLILPAVDLGTAAWAAWRRGAGPPLDLLRRGMGFAGGFALGLVPQLLAWHALYGSILPPAARTRYLEGWPRHLLSVLASPDRGLLTWHPVWLVGVVGLVLLARRIGRPGWALLGVFVAQLLLFGSVANWSGGMAFGQRRLLACLFVVVLGVAEVVRRLRPRVATGLIAVLVWLNLSLLIQFATGMIPRQGSVSWSRIARNHVTEVPMRAWDVGRSYLFDRSALLDESGR